MSTSKTASRFIPRILMAPAVVTLLLWMLVPLGMTIYFSAIRYNLMQPDQTGFVGWANYEFFMFNPVFTDAILNTLVLLGSTVIITVVFGLAIALLINDPFPGQNLVRILLISPILRNANSKRFAVEAHDDESYLWGTGSSLGFLWDGPDQLAPRFTSIFHHYHAQLAMDALCLLDFHDITSIYG